MQYKYGHFNDAGDEFIITNPETPRAFDNFLWNESVFSNTWQTGVGYMDYQVGENEAIQLFTGVGRICDFDVFGREHLMNRLVYIRDNDTGEFWNINWEPVKSKFADYKCIHGMGYTILQNLTKEVNSDFRIFVPSGKDPVELWTIKLTNSGQNKRNLSVFVYNQFQFKYKWGFDSYGDMIYRTSFFDSKYNAFIAQKHPFKRPHNYLSAYMTSDRKIDGFDGSQNIFCGTYSGLHEPEAVVEGKCFNSPGSSESTIGVTQFDLIISNGETETIDILVGVVDDLEYISDYKEKYQGKFDFYFNELKDEKVKLTAHNSIKTPDNVLNTFQNVWLKQVCLYGSTWCRWGWMGYRDIVQHGFGVVSIEPERTKSILIEAFRHQYSTGLAIRGWNPVDTKPYSDSALWLVFTLTAYIKETGDYGILQEVIPYYDEGEGSVVEHIKRALDFLENNKGIHNLCLIKYGDWNDSLTAVGAKGKGESVWLSQAYGYACIQMYQLYDSIGDTQMADNYMQRYLRIKRMINKNAWDGEWFVRGYADDGMPIGSSQNEAGKIFIESQAWALIANICDEEKLNSVINSCEKHLGTPLGYALLSPVFTETDDRIGRISSMEPGICENGTIYTHTNIWMVLGLILNGKNEEAYELFKKITPGYPDESGYKNGALPYMYANCYFGESHRNRKYEMEFSWITGSVAWVYNTILGNILGVSADYKGLRISHGAPSEWKSYNVNRNFRNDVYNITFKNPNEISNGKVKISVDGKHIKGNLLRYIGDGKNHNVEVMIV